MNLQTVKGTIPAEKIGITLPHEHVGFYLTCWWRDHADKRFANIKQDPVKLDNLGLVKRGSNFSRDNLKFFDFRVFSQEVKDFREAGGATIVDVNVDGIGRNPRRLKRVSDATGVQIVAATGFYVQLSHPPRVAKSTVDMLAQEMVKDIIEGIGNTGIKAGIIGEIGISPGRIRPNERKVLQAAAKAHRETSTRITVHTWADPPTKRQPLKVLDVLEKNDVNLSNVFMSHMDWTKDWNYVSNVIDRGAYVAFDGFGIEWPHGFDSTGLVAPTDYERAVGVSELIKRGYLDRVMLSHDVCHKIHLKKYGGHGFSHLLQNVIPILKIVGVSDSQIRTMMMDNPRRFFT